MRATQGSFSPRRLAKTSRAAAPEKPRCFVSSSLSFPEFLALKQESRILQQSSNPVCGFSMMEQARLHAHGELAWLFLEPDTELDQCPRILLS